MSEHPEFWHPRGIGRDGGFRCLVTGREVDLGPNIAGFVTSREAGLRIVRDVFNGKARLDYRETAPNRVQVKVGVIDETHTPVLDRLYMAVSLCAGMINPRIVLWAIDPVNNPGYMPHAYKIHQDLVRVRATLKDYA